ncbi:DNA (cytosine-5-)-methyltransferase [Euryarchaeota archaeon]|nr:DNA (cytosine-5-)-methyltransferase [Euryarchaeota archaeon]
MRVVELFAGVGGFRIGFEGPPDQSDRSRFQVIWANQWEPSTKTQHAAQVYVDKWNLEVTDDLEIFSNGSQDIFVNKDIATIDAGDIPDHDLICGGFPCQDYSVAKTLPTAHGIAGKKGVLWWEIRRIIEAKKPKYALLENVDRLLKSPRVQRGRDFAVMLASLSDLGYSVEWRVVDSSEYGFPQRRKRVFIFAELNPHWTNPRERLESDGVFAKSLPIHKLESVESINIGKGSLSEITEQFNSKKGDTPTPFGNCGVMIDREILTGKCKPNYLGDKKNLSSILVNPGKISDSFILNSDSLLRDKGWIYHKGGKKEMREGTDGFTYKYSEGPVTFPDALDRASRTIVTGEGGTSPSRFKHVVKFKPTKGQIKRLELSSSDCNKVREKLGLGKSYWLRRLIPVELEKLNGFPANHTELASDGKRAFFMGNALVCGIVKKISMGILIE